MSEKSSVSGGGSRTTETHGSGTRDWTHDKHGSTVDITDHEKDGSSHSHEVGHGILGPFAGSIKKDK